MADLSDIVSRHVQSRRTVENVGRTSVRDALGYMKMFKGSYEEKVAQWDFFQTKLGELVRTVVRLQKFEHALRGQQGQFLGDDVAPIEAALNEQATSMSATPGEVQNHQLMREFLTARKDMLDEDEVEMEENDALGKCPVSQESLDALPRHEVYGSHACIHHFSKQIFTLFGAGAHARTTCPVPGCGRSLLRSSIKALA